MKHWLKKWLPDRKTFDRKNLSWLPNWVRRYPYLWIFNRNTVAKGVAAGLLVAFIPIPIQALFAVVLAFLIRANLPIAVFSTLFSNPFTFVPISLIIYKVGVYITHSNMNEMPSMGELKLSWGNMTFAWREIILWLKSLGKNYLIGLVVVSVSASIIGYLFVQIFWHISTWWYSKIKKKRNNIKKMK